MKIRPKWKMVKSFYSGHGVNFIYEDMGDVAYINGYPRAWPSSVTVSVLKFPCRDFPPSLDWNDVIAETKAAVTAYLAGEMGPQFSMGRVKVVWGG